MYMFTRNTFIWKGTLWLGESCSYFFYLDTVCNKYSKVCHILFLKVPQSNEWMEYWELKWVLLLLESKTISHIFFPHTKWQKNVSSFQKCDLFREAQRLRESEVWICRWKDAIQLSWRVQWKWKAEGWQMWWDPESVHAPHFSAPLKAFFIPAHSSKSALVKYQGWLI